MTSALNVTKTEVSAMARFRRFAAGLPASSGGVTAPAALFRISNPTNVETEINKKIASEIRNVVSTVRIAEASMHVTASIARNI